MRPGLLAQERAPAIGALPKVVSRRRKRCGLQCLINVLENIFAKFLAVHVASIVSALRNKKVQFGGDDLFELANGIMKSGLYGPRGYPDSRRYLLNLQVFVVTQHDDFAVLWREALDRLSKHRSAEIFIAGWTRFEALL